MLSTFSPLVLFLTHEKSAREGKGRETLSPMLKDCVLSVYREIGTSSVAKWCLFIKCFLVLSIWILTNISRRELIVQPVDTRTNCV